MIYICIATLEEMKLLPRVLPEYIWDQSPRIVITGVGGSNVVRKLRAATFPEDYDPMKVDVTFLTGMCVPPVMTAQIAHQIKEQLFV